MAIINSEIIVRPDALEAVKRIADLSAELDDRQKFLEEKATRECQEIVARSQAEFTILQRQIVDEVEEKWAVICDSLGIPKDERDCWHLDVAYLKHGLAFVRQDDKGEQKKVTRAFVQSRLAGEKH